MARRRKSRFEDVMLGLLFGLVFLFLGSVWLEWSRAGDAGGEGEEAAAVDSTGPVRVEILNGNGTPGAAETAASVLRAMNFDVVFYGNADSFDHEETRVLDRSGRAGAARAVADSLGVSEVVDRPEPELYLDATVILGEDWRRHLPEGRGSRPGPGGRGERPGP